MIWFLFGSAKQPHNVHVEGSVTQRRNSIFFHNEYLISKMFRKMWAFQ